MQMLTLKDLSLGLNDLMTGKRVDAFKPTSTYILYAPMLAEKLKALNLLPAAVIENRPLAGLLAEIDACHDGFGAAVWFLTEAVLRHPKSSPALKRAAERVRTSFIPRLGVLKLPYADEASTAQRNRPLLADFEADLKAIPTPDNATLYDWVVAFLDEGDKLGTHLSERATIKAGTVSDAHLLRTSIIGLLGRARVALADEVAFNSSLPRNLDAIVFGYFDELNKFREAASATAVAEPPPPSVPPPPSPPAENP